MRYKNPETVDLPVLHPSVELPRHLAKTLQLIIDARCTGINSLELIAAGCIMPSKYVSKLRSIGALIETRLKDVTNAQGDLHKGVANYYFVGWKLDEYRPMNTIFMDEFI